MRWGRAALVAAGLLAVMVFGATKPTPPSSTAPVSADQPTLDMSEAAIYRRSTSSQRNALVRQQVSLQKVAWERGGFGSVAIMSATIENKSAHPFKDVELICTFYGQSGTAINSRRETIYDNFPAKGSKRVKALNMGLIHSQVASASCETGSLVTTD